MSETPTLSHMSGHDGVAIAVHRLGTGRPVVMVHGLASNATINWIRYGHAARIAAAGFEAVMIDLRGHGESAAPHDPAAYPHDVLALDLEAVMAELGFDDYDLVGYSLGARLSAMLVTRGARPRRLVLGGMGLEGLTDWVGRRDYFLACLDRWDVAKLGDRDFLAIQFMKTVGLDREAARLLLLSLDDVPDDFLTQIVVPTLVLCGAEDQDNGSAAALAEALPDAALVIVPGTHMNCITRPDFGIAIADYLST